MSNSDDRPMPEYSSDYRPGEIVPLAKPRGDSIQPPAGQPYGASAGQPYGAAAGQQYGAAAGQQYGASAGQPYGDQPDREWPSGGQSSGLQPYGGQPSYGAQPSYGNQPSYGGQAYGGQGYGGQAVPVQGYGPYVPVVALKDSGIAYLLWFFLGGLGVHQFYLGRAGFGVTYLVLSLLGWATLWFGVGLFLLVPLGIMLLIDLFLIPGYVRDVNARAMGVQRPF